MTKLTHKIIKGVKCRPLKNGQLARRGDAWPDGKKVSMFAWQTYQQKEYDQIYRPLPRKAKKRKPEPKVKAVKCWIHPTYLDFKEGVLRYEDGAELRRDQDADCGIDLQILITPITKGRK